VSLQLVSTLRWTEQVDGHERLRSSALVAAVVGASDASEIKVVENAEDLAAHPSHHDVVDAHVALHDLRVTAQPAQTLHIC
jgi:hypothetical protein